MSAIGGGNDEQRCTVGGGTGGASKLRLLKMCNNPIGDGALDALQMLIRCRPSPLEELHMQYSWLSQDACRAVRRAYYEPGGFRRLLVLL